VVELGAYLGKEHFEFGFCGECVGLVNGHNGDCLKVNNSTMPLVDALQTQ
jgi:hypothetical protein